jgi:hypothetical protein
MVDSMVEQMERKKVEMMAVQMVVSWVGLLVETMVAWKVD